MAQVWEEVRGNALWDGIKEGAKLMLPFITGLGLRQWATEHAVAFAWGAALAVAAGVAFWDQIPKRNRQISSAVTPEPPTLQTFSAPYHGEDTGIKLESAMFGAPGVEPENVTRKVRSWISKGNDSIPVSWQLLLDGRDPKPHAYKYLTATFSITEIEGKSVSVPLSQQSVSQEISKLTAQVEDERKRAEENFSKYNEAVQERQQAFANEREALTYRDKARSELAELRKSIKPSIPELLIRYIVKDRNEILVFRNDGHVSLQRISIGPLFMSQVDPKAPSNSASKTIQVTCFNTLGVLSPGEEAECQIGASENNSGKPLPEFLREFLKLNWTSDFALTAKYEDMQGRKFSRMFMFSIDPFNRIATEALVPELVVSAERQPRALESE